MIGHYVDLFQHGRDPYRDPVLHEIDCHGENPEQDHDGDHRPVDRLSARLPFRRQPLV